jgi:uncharacterized protein YecT (DUF1311 family)
MVRIGFAFAAVAAAAALVPLVGAVGRSGHADAVAVAAQIQVIVSPAVRSADAIVLEACLGQKGARLAAKCVGNLAEKCLKERPNGGAAQETECYQREGEAWSRLLDDYRGKIEKRLVTDPKRLVDLRDGERAWLADRTRRCDAATPDAVCTMRESGRRVIQLRLIADQAGVTL